MWQRDVFHMKPVEIAFAVLCALCVVAFAAVAFHG
jgi:hypothetical protein